MTSAINSSLSGQLIHRILRQKPEVHLPDRVPSGPYRHTWINPSFLFFPMNPLKREDLADEPGKGGMGQIFTVFKVGACVPGDGFSPDEFFILRFNITTSLIRDINSPKRDNSNQNRSDQDQNVLSIQTRRTLPRISKSSPFFRSTSNGS